MRLNDRAALAFILAIILLGFIDITLVQRPAAFTVNLGGAVVPLVLIGYLIIGADTRVEQLRGILAAVITGGLVYALMKLLPSEPTEMILMDPLYLFAIVAGVTAYLIGRS